MNYIKVKWIHVFPDEPVWIYSEIDHDRREVRKIEVFLDGKMSFADNLRSSGTTRLSEEPIPNLADISADPQFEPSVIAENEFIAIWRAANLDC